MNDYDIERQVTEIFWEIVRTLGPDDPLYAWHEADLDGDETEPDKLQRAIKVARKLGVTLDNSE